MVQEKKIQKINKSYNKKEGIGLESSGRKTTFPQYAKWKEKQIKKQKKKGEKSVRYFVNDKIKDSWFFFKREKLIKK
jgi:hypothetical protein